MEWFKWLRYYLDFCFKYHLSTREPETEVLYLQKLSSKGQSDLQQQQASACIRLFREVAQRFPAQGKEQEQAAELTDWGQTLVEIGIAIGIGIGIDIQTRHENQIPTRFLLPVQC